MKRIDFVIVGAQKAGTTSLFHILNDHSEVHGAKTKEVHYFDTNEAYKKGVGFYHRYFNFDRVSNNSLIFEATPAYLYHPEAANRILKYNPNIKIIIALRDPVFRALSAWNMYHYRHNIIDYPQSYDSRDFGLAIEMELNNIANTNWYNDKKSYITRGIYYPQLLKYFDVFPMRNIFVFEFNEFTKNHDLLIEKICHFLGITNEQLPKRQLNAGDHLNTNNYRSEIKILKDFYEPHNQEVFDLLGLKFDWT